MKNRVVLSTVAGSLLLATPVIAADVPAPVPLSVADAWWVFHGEFEAGGRFFLNNPQKDGIKSQNGQALGKYYEYSDIKPGPFLNAWLNGQTKDGLYNFNVWGDNVGYNDQRYEVDWSKAGEHYFDAIWDQTPHVYSTNARDDLQRSWRACPCSAARTVKPAVHRCRMHEGRRQRSLAAAPVVTPPPRNEPRSSAI